MNMFQKFALRDAIIVGLAGAAWWSIAGMSAQSGPIGDLTGVVTGALIGASAFALHEWGHLLAAFAAGADAQPNSHLKTTLLFSYDAEHSSLGQFLIMSAGGFAVTGFFLWLTYGVLPDGLLATRVARGIVAFQASLTVLLEFPLVAIALFKGRAPAEAGVKLAPQTSERGAG